MSHKPATPPSDETQHTAHDIHPEDIIAADDHDDAAYSEGGVSQQFLLQQLANLQADLDEQKNNALRAIAEMENIRRRAQDDIQKASKFAIESFAEHLLSAKDSLEMALSNPNIDADNLLQGVELTLKQLSHAFERAKISEVASTGQAFDPAIHQAVSTVPSEQPANTVVQVYQKGYRLNDRVLRPALVVVSQG
jgi:molecular chaperone GrpE